MGLFFQILIFFLKKGLKRYLKEIYVASVVDKMSICGSHLRENNHLFCVTLQQIYYYEQLCASRRGNHDSCGKRV